jgi:hypothetical protein
MQLSNIRILIVEDNAGDLRLIQEVFADSRHLVNLMALTLSAQYSALSEKTMKTWNL